MRTGRFFAMVVLVWAGFSSISWGSSGWIAGKVGNALAFDGVNDYVDVLGYQGIAGTQSRTCCAWIKTSEINAGEILSWGSDSPGKKWYIVVSNGTLRVFVYSGNVIGTTRVDDGSWHHIAVVLEDDGSPNANEIKLYVDGVEDSISSSVPFGVDTGTTYNVKIGTWGGLNGGYYKGLLDEVCIYGRALEASEINPEAPMPADGLAAYWTMDETEGAIAHDSAVSHDGMLRYINSDYPGGTGLPDDPFQIASKADLLKMAADTVIYGKCFILTADIDMGGQEYLTAIIAPDNDTQYKSGYQGVPFTGTFDGNGHTISNFTIKNGYYHYDYYYDYWGFFGYIGVGGQVKNLKLNNFTIYRGRNYIGGIAGYNYQGTIDNCHVFGNVSGNECVGGLVGYMKDGTIKSCSYGTYPENFVSGCSAGGLVGFQYSGMIQNSCSSSFVQDLSNSYTLCIGGLVGMQRDGIIKNCYSKGSVSVGYRDLPIGGLVGEQYKGVIISSFSTTIVNSNYLNSGGLVGKGFSNQVVRSFWDTQISGKAVSAGGIGRTTEQLKQTTNYMGWNGDEAVWVLNEGIDYPHLSWENTPGNLLDSGTLDDILQGTGTLQDPYLIDDAADLNSIGLCPSEWGKCFSLTQDIDMSGITGTNFNRIGLNSITPFSGIFDGNDHIVRNLSYTTTNQESVVGLIGYICNATIENLGLENVNISSKGNQLGSLAGVQDGGNITNCYSIDGHITGGDMGADIGGLIGCQQDGTITSSYSSGIVSGGDQAQRLGGLAGTAKGQIVNCYSGCSVTGGHLSHYLGGLLGEAFGMVTDCYSAGPVTGGGYSNSIGGFVGNSIATINNCYCRGNVSGNNRSIFVGGFVGHQDGGIIRDSYASNCIYGNEYIGGFAGEQISGGIVNSYTSSSIDMPDDAEIVGGFASVGLGAIVNSFWDTQISDISYSSGARGRTTVQMKEAANYIAWNEPNQIIWTLDETNDYPRLAWENLPGTSLPVQSITDYITDGSGTSQDPYRVTNAMQLNIIGLFPDQWDRAFRFDDDIDMSDIDGIDYNRIGLSTLPFTGTIEGNGHVVRNFSYKSMGIESCVGVFGYVSGDATIKNLGLEKATIASAGIHIGSLCGKQDSGTITHCYSDGLIIGDYITGGLIGNQDGDGIIRNCFSTTAVIGNDLSDRLGGLVGQQDSGTITDCFSAGRVFGAGNIGGLVGYQGGSTAIVNSSYATGIVAGTGLNTGGLVGFRKGTVNSSFWDTQTSMKSTSAGGTGKTTRQMKTLSTFASVGWDFDPNDIDGDSQDWIMVQEGDSYPRLAWKPNIPDNGKQDGILYSGGAGILGSPFQIADITDFAELTESPSHWDKQFVLTSDIDLSDYAFSQAFISPQTRWQSPVPGPFYGTPFSGVFDGQGHTIHNMTIVSVPSSSRGFTGLFGEVKNGQIRNLGIEETVIRSSGNYCGSIAGYLENGSISQCYSTGSLGSSYHIGGLVGHNRSGVIDNCYSECNIENSSTYAGGLVGSNDSGVILNCYSTGAVNGSQNIGGFVGYGSGPIFGCFWDTQTSGRTTSADGTGKTTAQMKTLLTFTPPIWFDSPWNVGKTGYALFFGGIDDYVDVPGFQGIVGTQSRTCCAWIKTSEINAGEILSWGSDSPGKKWYINIYNGTVRVFVYSGNVIGTTRVDDGSWHHIAVVLEDDGSPNANEIKLYVDGVEDSISSSVPFEIDTGTTYNVKIGTWGGLSGGYYKGLLDEVCIYGRALEASEINPESAIPTEGLVAHWALDENEGIVTHDSVSSYDGILKNMGTGWDFTNESINGTEDIWRMCVDGVDYPRLNWESIDGDFACPDGVSMEDLDYFVGWWLLDNCTADNNYCGGGDIDASGNVDLGDYAVLAQHWLEGM